ncbi:MAG: hypothetical protein JJU05_15945 [Verrucomicrobia bacterium]|nr:hypothetical protein [Verrucomicrobiota bacterium]MCH8528916.1 hypothetical protein [Kiritimatiellia bacterium]
MRFWRAADERSLRRSLHERLLKQQDTLRKKSRRAKKVDSLFFTYTKKIFSIVVFALLLPGLFLLWLLQETAGFAAPATGSFALFAIAWFLSLFARTIFRHDMEIYFSMTLPLAATVVLNAAWRRLLTFSIAVSLIVFGSNVAHMHIGPKPAGLYLFALLHALAFVMTLLLFAGIRKGQHAFLLAITSLCLGLVRISAVVKETVLADLIDGISLLLPNEWIQQAHNAFLTGNFLQAGLWASLPIPCGFPVAVWIRRQNKVLLKTCLEEEWTLALVGLEDPDEERVTDIDPDQRGRVGIRLLKFVPEELRPFLDFFDGDLSAGDAVWSWAFRASVAGFLLTWIPHPLLQFPGLILLVVVLLFNTPILGGGWLRRSAEQGGYQPIALWALYPVEFKSLADTAWRINILRCLLALPFWMLAGVGIGKTFFTPLSGLCLSLSLWVTVAAYQGLAAVLILTETRVTVAKGKFWRKLVSCSGMLIWIGIFLATVALCFWMRQDVRVFRWWAPMVVLGVFSFGGVMRAWLVRECRGAFSDHVAVQSGR